MREIALAVTQFAAAPDPATNADRAEALVREAARQGADVVLLQELFATPYFCKTEDPAHFDLAAEADGHPLIARFAALAAELRVVLPVSFFEKAGQAHFNSAAMIDADGTVLGLYRKTHIPQNPGYQEKYYFSAGDTGFRVWDTAAGRIGLAICWDQWFPETARELVLIGAEVILYPTAIGSEPADPSWDSQPHWQRVMQGHAAANIVPVAAANRIGREAQDGTEVTFYGTSFVTDATGEVLVQLDRETGGVALARVDLDAAAALRRSWGVFRDRRPEHYVRQRGL